MNEFKSNISPASLFTSRMGLPGSQRETLYSGDIRQPWRSGYGFPMAAARLAANQALQLHCREDEVFAMLAALNRLLAQPETLTRAHALLLRLQAQTRQKLIRRLEMERDSISDSEKLELIAALEQALTEPAPQTTATRLENLLSPATPGHEIAGLKTMLVRLQRWTLALAAVKDNGFHVVVQDRQRQPAHPAQEARRNEAVRLENRSMTLPAGFLFPAKYHLTLWAYLIVRSDYGQSTVWN